MNSQEIKALTGQYILNTYGRFPVALDHGQGATLYNPEGKAYIDFASGIGVASLGYGDEDWTGAIAAVFHHDGLAGEFLNVGQGFHQRPRLLCV